MPQGPPSCPGGVQPTQPPPRPTHLRPAGARRRQRGGPRGLHPAPPATRVRHPLCLERRQGGEVKATAGTSPTPSPHLHGSTPVPEGPRAGRPPPSRSLVQSFLGTCLHHCAPSAGDGGRDGQRGQGARRRRAGPCIRRRAGRIRQGEARCTGRLGPCWGACDAASRPLPPTTPSPPPMHMPRQHHACQQTPRSRSGHGLGRIFINSVAHLPTQPLPTSPPSAGGCKGDGCRGQGRRRERGRPREGHRP
jgi:hypothetical protein